MGAGSAANSSGNGGAAASDGASVSGGAAASGGAGAGPAGSAGEGASGAGGAGSTSPVRAVRLRVDLSEAPLSTQSATPRLRWELESMDPDARGLGQSGYEVLVASSAIKLAADQGDLFASGAVVSKSPFLTYAGVPLRSSQHAHWKVRARDQAGRLSGWSDGSEFTVGLMAASDWGAQWITSSADGMPIFRRDFSIAKPVRRALLSICGLGHYEVRVNGTNASDAVMEPSWTNYAKTCQYVTYDVTKALTSDKNTLGVLLGNGMYTCRTTRVTPSSLPPSVNLSSSSA